MTRRYLPAPVTSGPDGAVLTNYAKYAKQSVYTAYEAIGGDERFIDTADKDPKWFYEKFWTRAIPREVEVGTTEGVEELLKRLDAGEHALDITPSEVLEDA